MGVAQNLAAHAQSEVRWLYIESRVLVFKSCGNEYQLYIHINHARLSIMTIIMMNIENSWREIKGGGMSKVPR